MADKKLCECESEKDFEPIYITLIKYIYLYIYDLLHKNLNETNKLKMSVQKEGLESRARRPPPARGRELQGDPAPKVPLNTPLHAVLSMPMY